MPQFLSQALAFIRERTAKSEPQGPRRWRVTVKTLSERHRRRLHRHFLALGPSDRLLRFGSQLPDELVTRYVNGIDFERDVVFGVFDSAFRLAGVGHLAFAPSTEKESWKRATTKEQVAEFGVSVSESARRHGVGSKLFQRAAIHCRNADIDTLYMHCLSSNGTMMRIAKKAGMEIRRSYGEADAYLQLSPASPASMMQEAVDEQLAVFHYGWKSNRRRAGRWLQWLPEKLRRSRS